MLANEVQILLSTEADPKGLKEVGKGLGDIKKRAPEASKGLDDVSKSTGGITKSFIAAAAAIAGAYASLKSFVDASILQAKADKQLELAIRNNTDEYTRQGQSVKSLFADLKSYAEARQDATNIDDAATMQLQKMIIATGAAPNMINRLSAAFQDLEAGSGVAAESMARMWGRLAEAPEEALGALGRVGVKINKSMLEGMSAQQQQIFILEKLEAKYKGQAIEIGKAEGATGKFKNAIGNIREVIGDTVVKALDPFLKIITSIIDFFVQSPPIIKGLVGVLATLVIGLTGLGAAMIALKAIGVTSFAALKVAVTSFFASLGPIGWATIALTGLVSLLGVFSSSSKDAGEAIEGARSATEGLAGSIKKLDDETKAQSQSTQNQLAKLKSLKQGTAEYEATLKDLIRTNPSLANSNITVASSYQQVAQAVGSMTNALERGAAAKQYKDSFGALKDLSKSIPDLRRRRGASEADRHLYEAALVEREALRKSITTFADKLGYDRQETLTALASAMRSSWKFHLKDVGEIWYENERARRLYAEYAGSLDLSGAGTPIETSQLDMVFEAQQQGLFDNHDIKMRLLDEHFRRLAEEDKRHAETLKEISEAYYQDENQRIADKALAEIVHEREVVAIKKQNADELADYQKSIKDREIAEVVGAINTTAGYTQKAFDVVISAIDGDVQGVISGLLDAIPGVGSALSGIFNRIVSIFSTPVKTADELYSKVSKKMKRINLEKDAGKLSDEAYQKKALKALDGEQKKLEKKIKTDWKSGKQRREAEEAILMIERDRLRLQQEVTKEINKQNLSIQQRNLLNQIERLEQDIETGRRKKDYQTMLELQALYGDFLKSMSGLQHTDFYREWESKGASHIKGVLGEAGFQARAGTGQIVQIPQIQTAYSPQPIVRVDGGNTYSQPTTNINANLTLPPDFIPWFMRSLQTQNAGLRL